MGREIKRVPLDFDWPLETVWPGFKNPFDVSTKCTACDGSGLTKEAKLWHDKWYGNAPFEPSETGSIPYDENDTYIINMIAQKVKRWTTAEKIRIALYDHSYGFGDDGTFLLAEVKRMVAIFNNHWMHHLDQDDVNALWAKDRLYDFRREGQTEPPTAAMVNAWSLFGMGHDGINESVCLTSRCERMGIPYTCPVCDGDGEVWPNKASYALYEAYEDIEPPVGEGWQLWETVSEGSPVSPVFPTVEAFKAYLVSQGYSPNAVERFIEAGSAFSMMIVGNTLASDIATFDLLNPKEAQS